MALVQNQQTTLYFGLYNGPPEALRVEAMRARSEMSICAPKYIPGRQADGGSEPDSNLHHFLMNLDP